MTAEPNRDEFFDNEIPESWQEVLLVLAQMEDGMAPSEFQLEQVAGKSAARVVETVSDIPRSLVRRVRSTSSLRAPAYGRNAVDSNSYKLTKRAWRLLIDRRFFGEGLSCWLREHGTVVAEMEWDSGGPGAGAGIVRVYQLGPTYHVVHDAGTDEYTSERAAIRASGTRRRDPSIKSVWTRRSS